METLTTGMVFYYLVFTLMTTAVTDAWPNRCRYSTNCYGYCYNYGYYYCHPGCASSITNCEEVRCTTSSNQYCFKCNYDRGGIRKAYEAVDSDGHRQRICEQRCSWREDSKFCYPGTCPGLPSTCDCLNGFSDDNCLTITEAPQVEQCSGKIKQTGHTNVCDVECDQKQTTYCNTIADKVEFEWTTSYAPNIGDLSRPYYVNELRFGIMSSVLEWTLTREGTTTEGRTENCLSEESSILNIPPDDLPSRSCTQTISLSTKLRHNDRITFKLRTKNGGFIKINNYDEEHTETINPPVLYTGILREDTSTVAFDFADPRHCTGTSQDCDGSILDIGDAYRKNGVITVRWVPNDWQDSPAGIHHYDCEAFLLATDDANTPLGIRSEAPHASQRNIDHQISETVLNLPETGLFAIVFTIFDAVGNFAKARRFLIFDDDSEIEIDDNKPISVTPAVYNAQFFWLNVEEGDITVSWRGHFYNAFYRDDNLLNGIDEMDPPLGQYDEISGQPPSSRSREPIPNADGVIKFEIDFAESSSGRTMAENWVEVEGVETNHVISITGSNNDYITVWLKAYDVIGNTKEDEMSFYIDRTPPALTDMKIVSVNKNNTVERGVAAGSGILVKAHDDESGILEIRWELYDKKDTKVKYGEGKMDETSPNRQSRRQCTGSTCTCLTYAKICFYLDFVVPIDTTNLKNFPKGKVQCIARVTVVNNAMLTTMDTIEMSLTAPSYGAPSKGNSGVAAGVSVVVILLIVLGVLGLLFYLSRKGKLPHLQCRGKTGTSSQARTKGNENVFAMRENNAEMGRNDNFNYNKPPPQPPKVLNTSICSEATQDGTARAEMEFSSQKLVLKELVKPGINKAKATNIAGKVGNSLVVVKALKDYTNKTQRDHLLNELEIMLKISPHENVIRLLGCITQSGSPKPSIIMEFATYGNLSDVLRKSHRTDKQTEEDDIYSYDDMFDSKNTVSSDQLMQFAIQIAYGLEHLSDLKIIHRKLGARNIFVGDGKVCKIASFSHAITTTGQTVKDKPSGRLPIRWMAPESLAESEFSFQSDIWTYGIVLWEIVTLGATPYPGMSNKEVSGQIKSGERMEKPPHCTDELYTLMLGCWNMQPDYRPTSSDIVVEMRRITTGEEVMDLSQYDSDLYGDINDL
ncbi:uncharacterized protein LOC144452699 [Glandiceps talaboti]